MIRIYTLAASAAVMMAYGTARAETVVKPIPQPVAIPGPQGAPGPQGPAGTNGRDGIDGLAAIATLQTRTPTDGQWTGAFGLTGSDSVDGAALGVRYGLSDSTDVYAIVGHDRDGHTTWAAGVTWAFGGGK